MNKAEQLRHNLFQYTETYDEGVHRAITDFVNAIFLPGDTIWIGGMQSEVDGKDVLKFFALQQNLSNPSEEQQAFRQVRDRALTDLNKQLKGVGEVHFVPVDAEKVSIETMQQALSGRVDPEPVKSVVFDAQLRYGA